MTSVQEILRGLYRLRPAGIKGKGSKVHLFGSGPILLKALEAQIILAEQFGIAADVWSATSYKELRRDALAAERWNLLHPEEEPRRSYLEQLLENEEGVFVAASDYMKVLPESLGKWVPGQLVSLGTDGFGRSEGRASLRDFFEVDAKHIVLATLVALAREKQIGPDVLKKAVQELGINPEKANPAIS